MTYLISKCDVWQDDQGVRAAEPQLLSVDTLLSSFILDPELGPVRTTKIQVRTGNNSCTSVRDIYEEMSALLSVCYRDIFGHVVGHDVFKDQLPHRHIQH